MSLANNLRYTECGDDWREALDNASFWDHNCRLHRNAGQWVLRHFDDPYALTVDECGHVEHVEVTA